MKFNWKIASLFVLLSCVNARVATKYGLSVQSFECLGNCPVYLLRIDSLRNLSFEGNKNVKLGDYKDKISRSEYAYLTQIIDGLSDAELTGLEVGSLDGNNKEFVISKGALRNVLKVDNNNPQMLKLDSMINQILASRGLFD